MSYADFLADHYAQLNWGEWWVEIYIRDASDNPVTLRYSRHGTASPTSIVTVGSDTIAANTPFYRRLLQIPTYAQSLWAPPSGNGGKAKIGGSSSPSDGALILNNEDGALDQYHPQNGYKWAGAQVKVFNLDRRPSSIAASIGKYLDARVVTPQFALDAVTITLTGREGDFNQPLTQRVFRGRPWWLELYNGAKAVITPCPTAVKLLGDMTVQMWLWNESWPGGNEVIAGPLAPGPWRLLLNPTAHLIMGATIGSGVETVTSTLTLALTTMYHIAVTISGRDVTFYVWNDDTQTLTTETHVGAFSSSVRDTGTAQYGFASDFGQRYWLHDYRLYNVARTASEIDSDRFGLNTVPLPTSLKHWATFDDGAGASVLDSSASAITLTVSGGTSTWIPSYEGAAALQGVPKPETIGHVGRTAPVLVDANTQTYMVCGSGPCESIVSDEGGLPDTMLSEAASLRAFLIETNATIAGLHGARPYSARGLFRVASTPQQPMSANVYGRYRTGGVRTLTDLIKNVVLNFGAAPLPLTSGDLKSAAFTALAATTLGAAEAGIFIPQPAADPSGIHNTLDMLLQSAFGNWGYLRGETLFNVSQFTGPATVADFNFTGADIIDVKDSGPTTAVFQVIVLFAQNFVPLSGGEVAGAIAGTSAEYLLAQQWQSVQSVNSQVRKDNPGTASISVTVESCLNERSAAQALADLIMSVLSRIGSGWHVTLKAPGRQLTQGQTVTLNYTKFDNSGRRLSFDGTRKYIVLSVSESQQNGTAVADLWG